MDYHIDDFTEQNYRRLLLLAKSEYRFISYQNAFKAEKGLLWRHDVDFSVNCAHTLARIEQESGVSAYYFAQLHSEFYSVMERDTLIKLREIAAMGHAVGLHFDPSFYDFPFGDKAGLEVCLRKDKACLEDLLGQEIPIFSFHNPDVNGYWGNLPDRFLGGMFNVYCKELREGYTYCSDSNGYWRYKRLEDVLTLEKPARLQVLTHPGWWQADSMAPRRRIYRLVYGRADAVMQKYDGVMRSNGRDNIDDDACVAFERCFIPIQTKRLFLRPLRSDDLDDMFDYTSNAAVTKYLSWKPKTREQTQDFINAVLLAYQAQTDYLWGIALEGSDKLIGAIRLFDVDLKNKCCEVSYIVNPVYQGKNYASEALRAIITHAQNVMQMMRVQARCCAENLASERIMQKSGMQYEGTLYKSCIMKGQAVDMKLYSAVQIISGKTSLI